MRYYKVIIFDWLNKIEQIKSFATWTAANNFAKKRTAVTIQKPTDYKSYKIQTVFELYEKKAC